MKEWLLDERASRQRRGIVVEEADAFSPTITTANRFIRIKKSQDGGFAWSLIKLAGCAENTKRSRTSQPLGADNLPIIPAGCRELKVVPIGAQVPARFSWLVQSKEVNQRAEGGRLVPAAGIIEEIAWE
jgi:hypothetical protein